MFFKPAENPARRPLRVASAQLPRFAKLVREAWWLVSAAVVCYLALILATYAKSDPGWSFSGTGEPLANRGGIVGAWLADLLFYLFGVSAWWWVWGALVLLIAGYRRVVRPEREFEHPLALGLFGFALALLASAALEAIRLWGHSLVLPLAPGGALGGAIGHGLVSAIGFNGATLFLLALLAAGSSLLFGVSWLRALEHIGGACESVIAWVRNKRLQAADRRIGEEVAAERDVLVEQLREDAGERDPLLVVPPVGVVPKSERVVKERQRPLFIDLPDSPLPPLALLEDAPQSVETVANETLDYTSRLIERKLADFGVSVRVLAAYPGPVITRYEIEPAVGVKGAQIVNLVKDLARALSVVSIRVVETIPGKSCMGLELPNPKRQIVKLVEILSSATYNDTPGALTLALGKDIAGKAVVADLARMPHLLVAGTTGSGKSVAVNAMILSLLYKAEPRQVRLLLIDPKMLELSVYEGIPHLLAPVVTDMKLAPNALNWCVAEMERRYKLISQLGVRNLGTYNARIVEAKKAGKPLANPLTSTPGAPEPLEEMPLIVVVVDELADLMMVTGKKIEELIARIAQKARAAGIHLILATQRPSVDVITGLIKANIPSRIAFQVASKVDARTILDQGGAEALLGQGDMLFLPPGTGYPLRVHGAFVSDGEVHRVVAHLKDQGEPLYVEGVLEHGDSSGDTEEGAATAAADAESDPMYDQAVNIVLKTRRPSISLVQRHLRIGYNRAARLIEQMERAGLVSAMQTNGNREVLVPAGKDRAV
ncbi:MAG: DNA translocase FtsK 4TM domain-containing protein [Betaproteobacteria bacterium]|nr:DNA translocase FtsK 4TM domain-containing protein [Betaproteobacteria bacterium]MBA3774962.1 DNA translocase FtsK 4TM domain-containing protein [Betaproteobacteria bacterium]